MNPLTTALADHFGRPRRVDPIRRNHASRICPNHASKIPSNHASKIRPIDGSLWPSRDGSDRAVLDTWPSCASRPPPHPHFSSLLDHGDSHASQRPSWQNPSPTIPPTMAYSPNSLPPTMAYSLFSRRVRAGSRLRASTCRKGRCEPDRELPKRRHDARASRLAR